MPNGVNIYYDWDPVFGPKLAAAKLDALSISIRADGFRNPLDRSVREVLIPEIKHQFEVGGDPRWRPLSSETLRQKRNSRILRESDNLYKAATAYARWKIRDDEATFTGLPGHAYYGMYHLSGTRNMPQRDWARWSNGSVIKIANIFDNWLDSKIEAVF